MNARELIKLEYEGEYYTFKELSQKTGISENKLRLRYHTGYRGKDLTKKLKRGRRFSDNRGGV